MDRILFPLRRIKGTKRGELKFERIDWGTALKEIGARIRYAIQQYLTTQDERWLKTVLVQVGRPNEDGVIFRMPRSFYRMDGAVNHTNQCSSSGRIAAVTTWQADRPNTEFWSSRLIIMLSDHLDGGHYFQQHAKRIIEGKVNGARIVSLNPRHSNTAAKADIWFPVWPGTDAAVFLAVVNLLLQSNSVNWDYVKNWWNWQDFLEDKDLLLELKDKGFINTLPLPEDQMRNMSKDDYIASLKQMNEDVRFGIFQQILKELYSSYTPEFAAAEILGPKELLGVDDSTYNAWLNEMINRIKQFANYVAWAGERIGSWFWRSVGAGNLGGVMAGRALYLIHALMGAIGKEGSVMPNTWHKFLAPSFGGDPTAAGLNASTQGGNPPAPLVWNEYIYPPEYPMTRNEVNPLIWINLLDDEWRSYWESKGFKIPDHLEVYMSVRIHTIVWSQAASFMVVKAFTHCVKDPQTGECKIDPNTGDIMYDKVKTVVVWDPNWSEGVFFADYVLPVGKALERTDNASMETFEGRWLSFRQSVYRRALELKLGGKDNLMNFIKQLGWKEPNVNDFQEGTAIPPSVYIHKYVGIGEVADWLETVVYLGWYIDPDGSLGVRKYYESKINPGKPIDVPDEFYQAYYDILVKDYPASMNSIMNITRFIGLDPSNENNRRVAIAEYIKRFGVIFGEGKPQPLKTAGLEQPISQPAHLDSSGKPIKDYIIRPLGDPTPNIDIKFAAKSVTTTPAKIDAYKRYAYDSSGNIIGIVIGGVQQGDTIVGGRVVVGYGTPSKKIEAFYSPTWKIFQPKPRGWTNNAYAIVIYPRNDAERQQFIHLVSQVHWYYVKQLVGKYQNGIVAPSVNIMRSPVLIHGRTADTKRMYELMHTHPLWMNPIDAQKLGVNTGDLVRVHVIDPFTGLEAGYVVYSVLVTDLMRPGVVHSGHHVGRFRLVNYIDIDGVRHYVLPFSSDRADAQTLLSDIYSADVNSQNATIRLKMVEGPIGVKREDVLENWKAWKHGVPRNEDLELIWWTTAGARLNWIIPVQIDPLSGQQVWNTIVYI
ncbi:MAG: molybdopterin-dependent oxidoreductase, partial [Sulfolobales archaeon]